MKIYLAGTASHESLIKKYEPKYILESYYYVKDWQIDIINEDFMLDSGAFSFMADAKKKQIGTSMRISMPILLKAII